MDLLLNGMGLPKTHNNPLCIAIYPDGVVKEEAGEGFLIHTKAKAIELPAHHGLKDFGDILRIFDKVIHDVDDDTNALLCDLIAQIQAAPTIVEASNE